MQKQLFSSFVATGILRISSTNPPPTLEEERRLNAEFLSRGKGKQKYHVNLEEGSDESDDPVHVAEPILTESRRRVPKRSQSKSSQMQECMDIFRGSFTKNQQDTPPSAKKSKSVSSPEKLEKNSIEEALNELAKLESRIPQSLFVKAAKHSLIRAPEGFSCVIGDHLTNNMSRYGTASDNDNNPGDNDNEYTRKGITVEEQVGMFMLVILHSMRFSMVAERFQHSKETVSRVIKQIARGMQELSADFITSRNVIVQPEIENDERWRFFRHCIRAIDGTHVDACMPHANRVPYRDRNADISQNVLAACTHDMMFTYVMTGWEGSTHDSRIFADAASLDRFPAPRGRQYYVVDAGFSNIPRYLAPYKGEWYHRSDFPYHYPPTSEKELFNQRHASADYDEFRNPPQQHGIRVDVDMSNAEMNVVRDRIANRLRRAERGGR
ncbi:hypothetical protein CRG98_014019 [Punica granatum]|uniref:Uncharacterized protein n=1 Tax=Punica granatum TaxID=22663 RepID=A0A2I0KAE8_PUNGR|nr:hypothetical protein CRG98_014019 [Punica granatum]